MFLVPIAVLVVIVWRKSTIAPGWRVAGCAYLLLALVLHHEVWTEDFGFMRILSEWFLASALIVLASKARATRAATATVTFPLWLYLAHDLVTFLW
jgi:hypothetical protein